MKLPTLNYSSANLKDFVLFWSSFYNYPIEDLYASRIDKKQYSKDDLSQLFVWKNGSKLSQKKHKALQEIINKLEDINKLKTDFCLDTFKKEFKFVKGLIWKAYLLHLIAPDTYPIFDQHVCRAFYLVYKNQKKEIPLKNSDKEKVYFDEYVTFFNRLAKESDRKKLDEALWAFGKFLKSSYGKKL